MSIFDGEIDFRTVYTMDYDKKRMIPTKTYKTPDDNCLILGISRPSLRARINEPSNTPDVLCPLDKEYYKDAVKRFEQEFPLQTKRFMSGDLDATPVDHQSQDLKRTEYLVQFCSRELPFMSVNLARRARALQTLRLPDDVYIPPTTQSNSYRRPAPEKYAEPVANMSCRPKYDDTLTKKLREITCIRTGDTTYEDGYGLLARVILEAQPYGKSRKEPRYGKWRSPGYYNYQL